MFNFFLYFFAVIGALVSFVVFAIGLFMLWAYWLAQQELKRRERIDTLAKTTSEPTI